jgi:tetratricopeptide (TPR) repeat protein
LALLALAEPFYASVSLARLQAVPDTRSQAAEWLEQHIPAGSICCNFGGWAGDVPVATVEGLWWKINHYERLWGRETLDAMRPFLLRNGPSDSFYSYAIHPGNRNYEQGSMAAVHELGCSYVVLHDHDLSYPTLDFSFAREMSSRGERLARFAQLGHAEYDPIDGYYMPIGRFAELERTGPTIEIWRLHEPEKRWNSLREVFARAYVRGAATRLGADKLNDALALVERALALDEEDADTYLISAQIFERAERDGDALIFYERALALEPERADFWRSSGEVYQRLGDAEKAQRYMDKALALESAARRAGSKVDR